MRRSRRDDRDDRIIAPNGRHPPQVDDHGARGRDVHRSSTPAARVATANASRSLVIVADRATTVSARIFLMPFVADAAGSFKIQSAKILHGCHAVSYFLVLKKTCTHDIQKRKTALSSHRKCFQPPFRARDRAVSRTFELRAKKRRTRAELAQL